MQMRSKLFILAVLSLLVGVFLLHSSDREKILARLEEARTLAELQAPESNLELLVKARRLGELFTEQTRYDLAASGRGTRVVPSRQELVQKIARIRARLASLEIELQDISVDIDAGKATVQLRGTGLGAIRGEDGQFLEIHSAEIWLEKVEDDWLISGGRHLRDERQAAAQQQAPGG